MEKEKKLTSSTSIRLPTTPKQIRELTEKICKEFGFKDYQHSLFIICNAINYLPREAGSTTVGYFANCIRRQLAAKAAATLAKECAPDLHASELIEMLYAEPGDMQVRDELQKLADKGVEKAKAYLKGLDETRPN